MSIKIGKTMSVKTRINWEKTIELAREEAERYYSEQKSGITLRGLFYILVSKGYLPNTVSSYKRLSDVLAKERYHGRFPDYLISDVTRKTESLEVFEYYPHELSEEDLKREIEKMIESYASYSINAWNDQKHRVIIALEKEALFNITKTWISELKVEGIPIGVYSLRCLKGFDSATDIIRLSKTVKTLDECYYLPTILVISDFDPSGEEIFNDFKRRLYDLSNTPSLKVEKIMVTKDQIERYNLPHTPESEDEIAKLKRDTRFKKFHKQHGLMRVEVDAMYSIIPDIAKQILHQSILKYFDMETFKTKTLPRMESARETSEEVRKRMKEKIAKMLKS
jgi:5S rRNA maturation endonuclease (ribonuclease M5)